MGLAESAVAADGSYLDLMENIDHNHVASLVSARSTDA